MSYPDHALNALGVYEPLAVGDSVMVKSPLRDEKQPSLQIKREADKLLLNDFGGGATADILRAAGLRWADLFPPNGNGGAIPQNRPCTLANYAALKHLPVSFLTGLGLRDGRDKLNRACVDMDYHDATGAVMFSRKRLTLYKGTGKGQRFLQPKGQALELYGLWRLEEFKKRHGYIVLCEGESDCHTGWFYDLPFIGVPGSNGWTKNTGPKWAALLDDVDVYIWQETDSGGAALVDNVKANLPNALVISPDLKDISDYHIVGRDVVKEFETLRNNATATPATATQNTHGGKRTGAGRPAKTALLTEDYKQIFIDFGYKFALNQLDDSIENHNERFTDIDLDVLHGKLGDYCIVEGYKQSVSRVDWAVSTMANDNAYHPVKQWLESLTWDGDDHIKTLVSHFKDKDGCFYRWFALWLIGAIAQIYEADYQNPVLVLLGKQELGKSYFAKWLCSMLLRLFFEGSVFPSDKDYILRKATSFIWEIAEISGTLSRREVNAMKAFLTGRRARLRKPFGKMDIDKPTIASFIATDNNIEVLRDETGNRRFLVCELTSIDWDYSQSVDVNQLWAQAYHIYTTSGDGWRMTAAEKQYRDDQNQRHMVTDPLLEWLNEHLEKTGDDNDVTNFNAIWNGVPGKLGMSQYIPQSQYRQAAYKMSTWAAQNDVESENKRNVKHYKGVRLM